MPTTHGCTAFVLTLLTVATSCKSDPPPPTTTQAPLMPGPAVAPALESPSVHVHMAEHYDRAKQMKDSVIRGDLAAYQRAATFIAEHDVPAEAPGVWQVQGQRLVEVGKSARDARSLTEAASAVGRLGEACAGCHLELGKPRLTRAEPPAEGSGAQPHMARHQWAADHLWDGLMAPSDALWRAGADVMADAPLEPAALAPEQSAPTDVSALAESVHAHARAARATPKEERAAAYAQLIESCSACHTALAVELD